MNKKKLLSYIAAFCLSFAFFLSIFNTYMIWRITVFENAVVKTLTDLVDLKYLLEIYKKGHDKK